MLSHDLRHSLRMIRRSPGFAAVAVLSLALGIGANSAVYSVLYAVLLRTLAVERPESLVVFTTPFVVQNETRYQYSFSYPLYTGLRDRARTLDGLVAFRALPMNLSATGATERVTGAVVSGNYFSVLGVKAVRGAVFTHSDDGQPVVVLSHRLWANRFGSDPAIAGQTIRLNSHPFTIAGVAPPGFQGVEVGVIPDVFAPMTFVPELMPENANALTQPRNVWMQMMGRLKPGIDARQAEAELSLLLRQFNEEALARSPAVSAQGRRRVLEQRAALLPASTGMSYLRRNFTRPLLILMGIVGIVLLITCANVANLLLARATSRQRETAVRLALGASRSRLISQLMTESFLLAIPGAGLALLAARWMRDLLTGFLLQGRELDLSLDPHVLGATLLLGVATAVVFGLVPALQSTRPDVTPALKGADSAHGAARLFLRKGLVTLQVGLSLLVLAAAALFIRTLDNLERIDPGFETGKLLIASLDPRLNGYSPARAKAFYAQIEERVRSAPGVTAAGFADSEPLNNHTFWNIFPEGLNSPAHEPVSSPITLVSSGYFAAVGLPILLGRDFAARDTPLTSRVAIVNETFAKNYFAGEVPIGKRLGNGRRILDIEIVGMAGNSLYGGLREAAKPMLYLPVAQFSGFNSLVLHVRAASDPARLATAIRQQVAAIDASLPLFNVRTIEQQIERTLSQEKLFARLSGIFGLLALVLSSIGLYGVVAHSVTRRTREIGIRMALGAGRRAILRLVLIDAGKLVITGIILGIPAALALSRVIERMLYGVRPGDPAMLALASGLLLAVALFAAWIPAHRASRVDPLTALRYE